MARLVGGKILDRTALHDGVIVCVNVITQVLLVVDRLFLLPTKNHSLNSAAWEELVVIRTRAVITATDAAAAILFVAVFCRTCATNNVVVVCTKVPARGCRRHQEFRLSLCQSLRQDTRRRPSSKEIMKFTSVVCFFRSRKLHVLYCRRKIALVFAHWV